MPVPNIPSPSDYRALLAGMSQDDFASVRRAMQGHPRYDAQRDTLYLDERYPALPRFVIMEESERRATMNAYVPADAFRGLTAQRNVDPYRTMPPEHQLQAVSADDWRRLNMELAQLRRENADLKSRFQSLFKVPPENISPVAIDQHPTQPGQWRVRVHVKAYTVEGTIGELTAGKVNPAAAYTWAEKFSLHTAVLADGLRETAEQMKLRVGLRVFDAESAAIESIQPTPTPTEDDTNP